MNEIYGCENNAEDNDGKGGEINSREESGTSEDKVMEIQEADACKKRIERRRRRKCICKPKRRRRSRTIASANPFIIFYLEMLFKCMRGKPVTEVAREAGNRWYKMSDKEKDRYIKRAEKESLRRCRRKRGRKSKRSRRRRRRRC